MKKNLTEVIFILDKSGSMHPLTDDTIGGYNSMLESQRNGDGECYVTTVLFNENCSTLHDHVNIKEINPITKEDYITNGRTALLDAVGSTISSIGDRLRNTPEKERPEKVVVIISTDGEENSSEEFTKSTIKRMIEEQQNKYSWTFIFLGANMDAVSEASKYGISSSYAATWSPCSVGGQSVYVATNSVINTVRATSYEFDSDESSKAIADSLKTIV